MNLFLISKSVFSLSRYIFTCWHFHFLQIARTAAVACYLRYHRSSPFQIVPLHYFLLENLNVFAPFKISIPFSRKQSESSSQTNEHLHAKLFLSPPLPPHKTGAQCSPKAWSPPHTPPNPLSTITRECATAPRRSSSSSFAHQLWPAPSAPFVSSVSLILVQGLGMGGSLSLALSYSISNW